MPLVSIIMPVYNGERFLAEAIDSILNQSFTDFELIIINDGSKDNSDKIILSYNDSRIIYFKSEENSGLVSKLNYGISKANGKYIARMDCDDIAEPGRLKIQLEYFENNRGVKMVCSPVIGISAGGKLRDHWPADISNKTTRQIFNTLPHENCISHPTILIETEILRKYKYSAAQKDSEDWDLWLRLARDKVPVIKTDEVLLKYRIHDDSVTRTHNYKKSAQVKAALVKLRFVYSSVLSGKVNSFVARTFFYIFKDLGYHFKKFLLPCYLRKIKWFFTINPFDAYKQYSVLKKELGSHHSGFFFFFPYSHLGGAEKVHGQITKVIEDKEPFVFITGLKNGRLFARQFSDKARLLHVAKSLYHPFFSDLSRRLILNKISAIKNPFLFGANNRFFDELILMTDPGIKICDLTHDIDENEELSQEVLRSFLRINTRVFISNAAMAKMKAIYDRYFIDDHYKERFRLIYNAVEIPRERISRSWAGPLKIVYVGRDTPEKGVDRIFELAEHCLKMAMPFEFHFVGDIRKRAGGKNQIHHGVVLDGEKLSAIYNQGHFVIITSYREGFPLSIMEGMVHGCVPIATPVGDIPFHILPGIRGFLASSEPDKVSSSLKDILQKIVKKDFDPVEMSENCYAYAVSLFSKERFRAEYLELFRQVS
jgi:glycosyltransferase involved in cell wall biosynthesis